MALAATVAVWAVFFSAVYRHFKTPPLSIVQGQDSRFPAGHPPAFFFVTVTNRGAIAVKDVTITWYERGASGTTVGHLTETFYQVVPAHGQAEFRYKVDWVYPQAVLAEASITGWEQF